MTEIPTTSEALETFILSMTPETLDEWKGRAVGDAPVEFPAFDDALGERLATLKAPALARLSETGLRSLQDNFNFVLLVAKELIRRKDSELQTAFVDQVIRARDEYDPGHRVYNETVLDQLVDQLLPQFEAQPLVRLLRGLDFDVLDGDGFAALFAVVGDKLEAPVPDDLLSTARSYLDDAKSYAGDLSEAVATIATLGDATGDGRFAELAARYRGDVSIADALASDDHTVARPALDQVGKSVSFEEAVGFHNSFPALGFCAQELGMEFLEAFFRRYWDSVGDAKRPEHFLGRTLWPMFLCNAEAGKAFALEFADSLDADDRKVFVSVAEWAVRDASQREDAYATAEETVWLLKGENPAEKRAEQELEDRRDSLLSDICWPLRQNEPDAAFARIRDAEAQSIIDAAFVEELVSTIMTEADPWDLEQTTSTVALCWELLQWKQANPDPVNPDAGKASRRRRRSDRGRDGGVPAPDKVLGFLDEAIRQMALQEEQSSALSQDILEAATSELREAQSDVARFLALRVARYFGKARARDKVIEYARAAIGEPGPTAKFMLGKIENQPEFVWLRKDAEFKALLKGKKK